MLMQVECDEEIIYSKWSIIACFLKCMGLCDKSRWRNRLSKHQVRRNHQTTTEKVTLHHAWLPLRWSKCCSPNKIWKHLILKAGKNWKQTLKINSNCNYCARGELYHRDTSGSVFLLTLISEPSRDGQNTVVMRGGSQGEDKGARVRAARYSRARERSGLPGI